MVAATGGLGAFAGAALGQLVQLYRDKKQYQREDARHDREHQEALDNERRQRREDRYVALLTELTRLDRELQDTVLAVEEFARYRQLADRTPAGSGSDAIVRSMANKAAHLYEGSWRTTGDIRLDVSGAFLAAYGVASPAVREAGLRVTDWPNMAVASVDLKMLAEDHSDFFIVDGPDNRWVDRNEYARYVAATIGGLREEIATLDRLLREELRLGE